MFRIRVMLAVIPLSCLLQIAAIAETGSTRRSPQQGQPDLRPTALVAFHRLPPLPSGTPPVSVVPPTGPATSIGSAVPALAPSVPAVSPGESPFARTAFTGVFVRSSPGSALPYVTPDELARRSAFAPALSRAGSQPGLATDEVLLDCTLPARLAPNTQLAFVPRSQSPMTQKAPPIDKKGDAK